MGGCACCTQCLEQSRGDLGVCRGLPAVPASLYLLSLGWRSLGFPTLPLLAPGSSHRLGDMIVFLAACYIISPEGWFFFFFFNLSWAFPGRCDEGRRQRVDSSGWGWRICSQEAGGGLLASQRIGKKQPWG